MTDKQAPITISANKTTHALPHEQDRKQQDIEDEEEKERGRVETLLKIRKKSVDMKPELWKVTQEARCVDMLSLSCRYVENSPVVR